ncbi:MAG: MerR family transcriptional regulator [Gracilibacteraceae bacterium]|nr:MerR family transcriptional regulator [Gracilibacteraceae bacterium]
MLTDIPLRTVRYYIQIGLVDRPVGGTKAARYGAGHLEQLLTVKKWTAAGLALESIRELMHGETPPVEARAKTRGSVAVQSHLTVAGGIELVVDPEAAGLKPEQLRKFFREVTAVYDRIIGDDGSQSEIRR